MTVKWAWTREHPTEPGRYWYYGYVHGRTDVKKEFYFVEVFEKFTQMRGNFDYDYYPLDGHFIRAQLPAPP